MPLLSVQDLRCSFRSRDRLHNVVDGVSFHLERGEVLGVVGESGSGKSVTALSLLGLLPRPQAVIEAGSAFFGGRDLLRCRDDELRGIRGRHIAMVFQDPMTSLNPYMRIWEQVAEPLIIHQRMGTGEARRRARTALEEVGIQDPDTRLNQYPHEFSGGMRQRVLIATALVTRPALLIADEPTTALDVTVQAQIMRLIRGLQQQTGMGVLYITHDLGVVAGLCDRVQVMYAGRIVESAPVESLFSRPHHPYTRGLLRSMPSMHRKGESLSSIAGNVPDPRLGFPPGCRFMARCPLATDACAGEKATARNEAFPGHSHACWRIASEGGHK